METAIIKCLSAQMAERDLGEYLQIGMKNDKTIVNNHGIFNFNSVDVFWKVYAGTKVGLVSPHNSDSPQYNSVKAPIFIISPFHFFKLMENVYDDAPGNLAGCVFLNQAMSTDVCYELILQILRFLKPGGFLALHYTCPFEEWQESIGQNASTGNNWRALLKFRQRFPEYEVITYSYGAGLSIIYKTELSEEQIKIDPFLEQFRPETCQFKTFHQNRQQILNLV